MWGNRPWENDRAADWLSTLVDESGFAEKVRKMLRCLMEKKEWDDEEYLVRAAGYCLLKFGHVYIWPVDELSADLELTISAYDRLLSISDNQINESFQPQLDQELTELKARLKSISSR